MLDTAGGLEPGGQLFYLLRNSLHNNYLKTIMMIEMNMLRSTDNIVVLMLNIRQPRVQIARMVIVDQRNGAGHFFA